MRAPAASPFQAVIRARVWSTKDWSQRGDNRLTRMRILGSVSVHSRFVVLNLNCSGFITILGGFSIEVQMFICLDIDTEKVKNEIHSALVLDRQAHHRASDAVIEGF